jgi:HSP20 family protein
MQEQLKQHTPVKVYRTDERVMIAAPMPDLEPENIVFEIAADGCLLLHGDVRGMLKEGSA